MLGSAAWSDATVSHFLIDDRHPDGHRLEDVLAVLRKDLIRRMTLLLDDERQEARSVLDNDVRILEHLTAGMHLAEDSSRLLHRSFGPPVPGQPRIGV